MGISGTPEVTGTNTALAARTTALANPPACRVYHNVDQSIAHNTLAALAFNSERYDTDSMHDTATNNSRITINTAGVYVVEFGERWTTAADYTRILIDIRLNGTTTLRRFDSGAFSTSLSHALPLTTTYKFAVGDFIDVAVLHANGAAAARSVLATPNLSPEFSAVWLGLG